MNAPLQDISGLLAQLAALPEPSRAKTKTERNAEEYIRRKDRRKKVKHLAVLDMETDPFDAGEHSIVLPFLAVLYSDAFETKIIWNEDYEQLCDEVISFIEGLPDQFTIYAHNGGKFDYMFLCSRIRGAVQFKGRAIMSAKIGNHTLRDSLHIIPEKLASYKKDDFDYRKLTRKERHNWKQTIIDYCVSDCRYLLDIVKRFIDEYGPKISIGSAAMSVVKEHMEVGNVSRFTDARIRPYYLGGRVDCIRGAGYYTGPLKLFDVNSMYPFSMVAYRHPVSDELITRPGAPNENTAFVRIECSNNGALLGYDDQGKLTSRVQRGVFRTSIHEFKQARQLGLIWNIRYLESIDARRFATFENFVRPIYERRAANKSRLKTLAPGSREYDDCKAMVLFDKLIMNNCYGKYAENPAKYKKFFLTDRGKSPNDYCTADERQDWGELPEYDGETYWIWSRPDPGKRYRNVGTAASITGAARAMLMRAIHHAKNPIYCDTDSLICEELRGERIDEFELGAWDIEKEIKELIVVGRKLYAYRTTTGEQTLIKAKGAGGSIMDDPLKPQILRDIEWNDMLRLLADESLITVNRAPTLTRQGDQDYLRRIIRRTAPLAPHGGLTNGLSTSEQSASRLRTVSG